MVERKHLRESDDERIVELRSRELSRTHSQLSDTAAEIVAANELGYSNSGAAKLLDTTESTVSKYKNQIEEIVGVEALYPKTYDEMDGPAWFSKD